MDVTQTEEKKPRSFVDDVAIPFATGILAAEVVARVDDLLLSEIEGTGILLRCPVCECRHVVPLEDWYLNRALNGPPFTCSHDQRPEYEGEAPGVLESMEDEEEEEIDEADYLDICETIDEFEALWDDYGYDVPRDTLTAHELEIQKRLVGVVIKCSRSVDADRIRSILDREGVGGKNRPDSNRGCRIQSPAGLACYPTGV